MRGDVPGQVRTINTAVSFSPHARGCSGNHHMFEQLKQVFPACAGMFPNLPSESNACTRFPRMRGDVPEVAAYLPLADEFSPHTRGCSDQANHGEMGGRVFPAYAGMFSKGVGSQGNSDPFSPHTRGCSSLQPPNQPCSRGFPRIRGCSVFLGHA